MSLLSIHLEIMCTQSRPNYYSFIVKQQLGQADLQSRKDEQSVYEGISLWDKQIDIDLNVYGKNSHRKYRL